ncbi:MAG TPA: DUF5131 family protein, partial [Acetobacteraceae bacterium]|nr:DUF5131 family protein [Acetobacteraceae bacterium]
DHRFTGGANWGSKGTRTVTSESNWRKPLKWNRDAAAAGVRAKVFCASLADVGEDRPELRGPRARLALLIQNTPWLDWLLLTKRVEDFHRLFSEHWGDEWPENLWAGCTVENQEYADKRIPELLRVPARVRFLSCEPLLGPVDLEGVAGHPFGCEGLMGCEPKIHWVICGGESGPNARPMHPDWARSLRDQCEAAGVAFFIKQWGEWLPGGCNLNGPRWPHGGEPAGWRNSRVQYFADGDEYTFRVGKHAAGRLLDGREHSAFPEVGR